MNLVMLKYPLLSSSFNIICLFAVWNHCSSIRVKSWNFFPFSTILVILIIIIIANLFLDFRILKSLFYSDTANLISKKINLFSF